MVATPRPEISQTLMRWRVALQFIALCLVMAALYLSAKSSAFRSTERVHSLPAVCLACLLSSLAIPLENV